MPYGVYKIDFEIKADKSHPDNQFRKSQVPKVFYRLKPGYKNHAHKADGYNTVNLSLPFSSSFSQVYQDVLDKDRTCDKYLLVDGRTLTIEETTPREYDNYRFIWYKCGCRLSPAYRLTLHYQNESNEAPSYVTRA